ncbi:unnamed protein product [Ectocarpus sp. CCAP 1310/34]|nr:unnamed protein product [Ectocarpus sp. CCAP 1310/34]
MNTINHNNNNNRYNNNKTMTTSSIKITFQGASRDVNVRVPVMLASLQAAIAAAFDVELPARSSAGEAANDTDLSFTYKDPDGDDIVFDKESELQLALRLCPGSLEISAAGKENKATRMPDSEEKLYKIAARNLREYNGVPSMTPPKLVKTLAFLKLNPQRLVKQGLAPKVLLARMKAEAANNAKVSKVPLGDGKNNEDLAESVAAGMELMSVEDGKKEWNDGFVSVEPAEISFPANDNEEKNDAAPEAKKNLIHKAFIAGGIQLRPREVRPLLVALDVLPYRLAKLGLVGGKDLRAMLRAEKKTAHKRHGPGHAGLQHLGHVERMAHSGPRGPTGGFARGPAGLIMRVGSVRPGAGPSPGSGSGASGRTPEAGANVVPLGRGKMRAVFCGKPRVGMMMPRRCHPHAGMPPPPRPHMEHARAPGGGGGGVGQQQHGRHR